METEQKTIEINETSAKQTSLWRSAAVSVILGVVWYLVYKSLQPVADLFTYSMLRLPKTSHIGSAVAFFV